MCRLLLDRSQIFLVFILANICGQNFSREILETEKSVSLSKESESESVSRVVQPKISNRRGPSNSKFKDAIIDFSDSEELEEQQRLKRGYYFYGHPHSPNFFDRYFHREGRNRDHMGGSGSLGQRMLNRFRHGTSDLLNTANAVAFAHERYQHDEDEQDNEPAAGTHYSSGRGHGSGGGGYGKGVNKSAVGLLGFLSLLSLIQSGLTTTAAPTGRRRRDLDSLASSIPELKDSSKETQTRKIADIVMPLLSSFSYAVQEDNVSDERLKCVLNEICTSNSHLVSEYGEQGKEVGQMMGNVLEKLARKRLRKVHNPDTQLFVKLKYAARTGRNGKECEKNYPRSPKCENGSAPEVKIFLKQ